MCVDLVMEIYFLNLIFFFCTDFWRSHASADLLPLGGAGAGPLLGPPNAGGAHPLWREVRLRQPRAHIHEQSALTQGLAGVRQEDGGVRREAADAHQEQMICIFVHWIRKMFDFFFLFIHSVFFFFILLV